MCSSDRTSHAVQHLKQQLLRAQGIPRSMQRLLVNGRELHDDEILQECMTAGDNTVALLRVVPQFCSELLLEELSAGIIGLEPLAPELRCNRDVALCAVLYDACALGYVGEELQGDWDLVLKAFRSGRKPSSASLPPLAFVDDDLRADYEIVDAAVQQDGRSLQFASESLRGCKPIVLKAVKASGVALSYASPELKKDAELVLSALGRLDIGYDIKDLARADVATLSKAVAHCDAEGALLHNAPDLLRGDRDVVSLVVQWDGLSFQYASEEIRSDPDIAMSAACQRSAALQYVPRSLMLQRWFATIVVSRDWRSLEYFPEEIRGDARVVAQALKKDWGALALATKELQGDSGFLPEEMAQDRIFMLEAVESDSIAVKYASEELQLDRSFVDAAVRANGFCLRHVREEWRHDWSMRIASIMAIIARSMRHCAVSTCECACIFFILFILLVIAGTFVGGV